MVQLMKSGSLRPERETTPCRDKLPVKLEIEDSLEEEHGPFNKRSKPSTSYQQWSTGNNAYPIPPSQYNPLDEPSPLGLRLRKSPSLLDLIQMRLSQGNPSNAGCAPNKGPNPGDKKDPGKGNMALGTDKLKASNFPASLLRIGRWEYASRYEGDLVAKCYFAKHKLVWEVLEGGLKSKIEIQWSDIMALKANCPDDGPGTLNVVLARQPLFFRETNPQPRKHTLWQATADFTDGQASIHSSRIHHLWLPGCASPTAAQSSSLKIEPRDPVGLGFRKFVPESLPQLSDLLGSVMILMPMMDTRAMEGSRNCETDDLKRQRNWEQLKVPGLHPSISMSDLMNHIENRISEQMTSGNPALTSDEKSLSRVNSLCCLLQKDPGSVQNLQMNGEGCFEELDEKKDVQLNHTLNQCMRTRLQVILRSLRGLQGCHWLQAGTSHVEERLVWGSVASSPRITSLPKFLFNISEDDENQAR
ncbi:hypothetical protein CK203_109954 [Vitis vinifera]|uniref:TRF2/HOY1 PH-like domain-containing protein n=1 Tax=Vitis vinifera TaxID=29760 RepID=A0A438CDG1_VITVI|nr:hypothetical protein CK203_109954 [Vitis vinifera]